MKQLLPNAIITHFSYAFFLFCMLRLANPNVCRIRVCETESPFYHELFHPGAKPWLHLKDWLTETLRVRHSFTAEIMAVLLIHAQ